MPFQKGQSGNPNGRPRKNRALAEQLRAVLKKGAGSKHCAEIAVALLTTGSAKFPDGRVIKVQSAKEWLEIYRMVAVHLDGPAPADVDLNVPDGLHLVVEYVNRWDEEQPGS